MSQTITYPTFVEYRAKINQAKDDLESGKKSAASNRLRSVNKHRDE